VFMGMEARELGILTTHDYGYLENPGGGRIG
jgi:hypothetical protein